MFCSNCGKQLENNASFCSNCGTKMAGGTPSSGTSRLKSSYDRNNIYTGIKPTYESTSSTSAGTSTGYESTSSVHAETPRTYGSTPKTYGSGYGTYDGMNGYPGAPMGMGVRGYTYSGAKIVWGIFAAISTLFVALAGIVPVMSAGGEPYTTFGLFKRICELFESIRKNSYWGFYGDTSEMQMYTILAIIGMGLALIFYLVSVIYALVAFGNFLSGKSDVYVAGSMDVTTRFGLVHMLIPVVLGVIFNIYAGQTVFYPSVWGWIVMVIAFVNIIVFIRGYRGKDIFGIPTAPQAAIEGYVEGKICLVCHSEFAMGNCCPRCGSYAIRMKY